MSYSEVASDGYRKWWGLFWIFQCSYQLYLARPLGSVFRVAVSYFTTATCKRIVALHEKYMTKELFGVHHRVLLSLFPQAF